MTRYTLLTTLALLLSVPAEAHAQSRHRGHQRPVHVVRSPDHRLVAEVEALEREIRDLRDDVRAFDDATALEHLRDARSHKNDAEAALRRNRQRAAVASIDSAEQALGAAERRLATLEAELRALRRQARSEIDAAQRATARRASHEAIRLAITAESAGIDGDGAMIRRDYLDARTAYARAIDSAQRAQRIAYATPRHYDRRGRPPHREAAWGGDDDASYGRGGYVPARWDDGTACPNRGRRDRGPW